MGFCDLRLPGKEYPYGYSFNENEGNFPVQNLRFLGLMSMIDLPRRAVPHASVSPNFSLYNLQPYLFFLI